MKRVFVICMLVAGMAGSSTPGRAQFLKNLVNNVKQNLSNKAAGNTTSATGKPDSASAAAKSANDSAMLAKILGNASKPKPMTAADSAAVKGFMTASGGSGMLYQYRVVYDFKKNGKDSTLVDTMSSAYSNGYTHVDMDMMGMKMQLLGHTNQPKYTVVLYAQSKSYLLNIIDTGALHADRDKMTYTVTRIGTETVAGYSCVHGKLSIVTASQKTPIVEDIWTSTAVPGYAEMKKQMGVQNVTVKMLEALDNAGCGGYPVKMTMQHTGEATGTATSKELTFSMEMVLITATRKSFPASEFEIPAGYAPANTQSVMENIMAAMPKQK
jgi:hypothetical protein